MFNFSDCTTVIQKSQGKLYSSRTQVRQATLSVIELGRTPKLMMAKSNSYPILNNFDMLVDLFDMIKLQLSGLWGAFTIEDTQTHQFGPNLYPPPTPTTTIWNLNTSARIVNSKLLNNLLHSEYLLVVILLRLEKVGPGYIFLISDHQNRDNI